MSEQAAFVGFKWFMTAVIALTLVGAVTGLLPREHYPDSTADCPPGHVYIDHGETPQAGCWPEGAAQQMGAYPEPEEP